MAGISPEVYRELRQFVRQQGPFEEEPEGGEDMGGAGGEPGAVEIEVKSEPVAGQKTCPTCGQPTP